MRFPDGFPDVFFGFWIVVQVCFSIFRVLLLIQSFFVAEKPINARIISLTTIIKISFSWFTAFLDLTCQLIEGAIDVGSWL